MATVTVTYPSGPSFDLSYYLETHMSIVTRVWGPCGLKGYDILQYEQGQENQIQAILKWDSLESFGKAPKDEIMGDIPNFTTAKPLILAGESRSVVSL